MSVAEGFTESSSVFDLGESIARLRKETYSTRDSEKQELSLTVVTPASEGVPAQSVVVYGRSFIEELQRQLTEALK